MSFQNRVMRGAHYDCLSLSLPSGETGEQAAKTALRSVIGVRVPVSQPTAPGMADDYMQRVRSVVPRA